MAQLNIKIIICLWTYKFEYNRMIIIKSNWRIYFFIREQKDNNYLNRKEE